MRVIRSVVVALALVVVPAAASADVVVLCSNGFRAVLEEMRPQIERSIQHRLKVTYGLSAQLARAIERGQAFDVAILTPAMIDDLETHGSVVENSSVPLARSAVAFAVRRGMPSPDLSSTSAVRTAMTTFKSIGYAGEGASAVYLLALIERLGLTGIVQSRLVALPSAAAVAAAVGSGNVEAGVLPTSEILPVPTIMIAGTLPQEIAGYITMAAAVSRHSNQPAASKAFIGRLTTPAVRSLLVSKGMEPVPTATANR